MRILDYPVTVCAGCLRASCWLDIEPCGNQFASIEKTVAELRELKREEPLYWFKERGSGQIIQWAMREYEALP